MAGEALLCFAIIVILAILWAVYYTAKIMGYFGQYRGGKALKDIQRQGLTVHQQNQQTQPSTILPSQPSEQIVEKFCRYCGKSLPVDSEFCDKCGKKQ